MKWRQVGKPVQGLGHRGVDPDRAAKAVTAMNDPVSHCARGREVGDSALDLGPIENSAVNLNISACDQGVVLVEQPQLETARTGVDGEDPQPATGASRLA
jgi:hypothetical protein